MTNFNMQAKLLLPAIAALALVAGCNKAAEQAKPASETAAAAKPAEQKPPVAIIDGTPISADVWDFYVKTRSGGRGVADLTVEQRQEALEDLIRMYVASNQATKEGLDREGESAARIELMRRTALAELIGAKVVGSKEPTPEELKAEYDRQVAQMPKAEYHARHILVPSEELAKKVIEELNKGAKFEDLAKRESIDPSKEQGGDLGWFPPQRMVKPFADAVQTLKKGETTKTPVQTQFGWHVIRLEDTRPITPPPYEAVEKQLGPLVQQRKFRDYIDGLAKQAKIERKL